MKKVFTETLNFITHNTGFLLSAAVSIALAVSIYSCTPTARSIIDPSRMVTRDELTIEADQLIATIDLRFKELRQKEAFQETVFDHAIAWTETGTLNPVGLVTTLMAIAGIGATYDNVTKRRTEAKKYKRIAKKANGVTVQK
jgi:hypothetical protein